MADPAADPFAQYDTAAPANSNTAPAAGPGLQVMSTPTGVGAVATQTINGQVFAFNPATGNYDIPSVGGGGTSGGMAPPATPVVPTRTPIEVTPTPQADPFAKYEKTAAPNQVAPTAVTPATPANVAAAPPAAAAAPPEPPWHQPIKDAVHAVVNSLTTVPPEGSGPLGTPPTEGATNTLQHGFTLGLDEILAPLIPAAAESAATGKPFSEVYDAVQKQMRDPRKEFEAQHPYAAAALSAAGTVGAPPVFGRLFSGAPAASTFGSVGNAVRNTAAGTAAGAATGFTMADGGVDQRIEGAKEGALAGGALSLAAPVVTATARNVGRAFRPSGAVDTLAGTALRESAGLAPGDQVPAPAASPLPGTPIGTAAAFNNAGLARTERLVNTTDDAGRQAQIAAQTTGIRDAATTVQPGSGVRLATATTAPEASASVVSGLQKARGILRDEEERLWTKPSLTSLKNDVLAIQSKVGQALAKLPQRFQAAIARTPDIQAALQDLRNLPQGASLADVNRIRSEILELSRSLPFDQRFAKKAADDVARAILDGIESNPALRTNPRALADYQDARRFSAKMHSALGTRVFQRMLQATEGNAKGLDAGTLAGQLFNFGKGTEINPAAVARVTDLLDDVRRQWGALQTGNAGVPLPGLSPAAAFGARAELAQGARDFIVHSMLDAASSNVRDQAGSQRFLMNKLSDWIDTNRDWISRSRLFTQKQIDIMDRIRDFSIKAQSAENLRGGTNSATYERFAGDRYVDAFIGPFLGRTVSKAGGALAGLVATGLLGEAGIGGMIGMELAGGVGGGALGHGAGGFLQKLYERPRQALMEKMTEAIRDPVIAEDLMKKAGSQVSPQTMAWARSLLATVPASEAARTIPSPGGVP